jgi:Holliday junction resolvasome RuvABC endonuclease subunit
MPILALDPATEMGWALSPLLSGVWDLSLRRDESMGMKFLRCRSKLNELLEHYRIQLVVYEAARNAAPKMQGSLVHQAQLQAIIIDWATMARIESKGYSPGAIKRWATGSGHASKEVMVAEARRRWPEITIVDDNQADALLLWQMAAEEFKFLINTNGKISPVNPSLEEEKPRTPKPAAPTTKTRPEAKLPGKIVRAFRKAGQEEAPLEAKQLFLAHLKEARIAFGQFSSNLLAKVIKGELSLESLTGGSGKR